MLLTSQTSSVYTCHGISYSWSKITSEKMMVAYNELLKLAKNDPPHNSYNLIISKGSAFYIPRKISQYKCGAVFNSFAISGNFSIWN